VRVRAWVVEKSENTEKESSWMRERAVGGRREEGGGV